MREKEQQSCDQCDAVVINGVFCHQFGCTNNMPEENWEDLTLFTEKENEKSKESKLQPENNAKLR